MPINDFRFFPLIPRAKLGVKHRVLMLAAHSVPLFEAHLLTRTLHSNTCVGPTKSFEATSWPDGKAFNRAEERTHRFPQGLQLFKH